MVWTVDDDGLMCLSFMLEPLGGDAKFAFLGEDSNGENIWFMLGEGCWGGWDNGGTPGVIIEFELVPPICCCCCL